MTDWKANSERLCRQVAGADLVNVPCYFVSTAELESYDPRLRNANCLAWTGIFADLLLCDFSLVPIVGVAGDSGAWLTLAK